MPESWPPQDDPRYGDDWPQRPPRPSGPRQPPRDPRQGGANPDPGYGGWAPPSGGYGQQPGAWGTPPGGAPGWQQGGGWGPPAGDGWGAPPGASDPRGPQPYPPYPPQPPTYPQYVPFAPQQAPSYGERYGYGDPYAPRGPYEPDEPPPSRAGTYALVIFLVALVLLGGGGAYLLTHAHRQPASAIAQPTATATATATPIPMRTITDDTAKMRFAIPVGWKTTGSVTATSGLVCSSPDDKSAIVIGSLAIPAGATYNLVNGAKGGLEGAANPQPVNFEQGPTTVALAGVDWTEMVGSFTANNEQIRGEVLVTDRGSRIYFLMLLATFYAYPTTQAHEFNAVEQSIAFLP
jgi:hypothetical protein